MTIANLPRSIDTLIVGAGHAGLSISAMLAEAGQEHLLVERRDRLGGSWQDRWDAFTTVTPSWVASFPGWPYDGPDRDAFMTRDQISERVARYADVLGAPVVLGTEVQRLVPEPGGGFTVRTNKGALAARRAVVATGSYHAPRIPPVGDSISSRVTQVHSHQYRNEPALPPGAVLVVGTGQTGVQIAEELHDAGRTVYLTVGTAGRLPRRYRGQDIFFWLAQLAMRGREFGIEMPTVDNLPDPNLKFVANPHVSGQGGGHDTNLRRFAADGMTLTGRLQRADGEQLGFAPDLARNLGHADQYFEKKRGLIDAFIDRAGIDAPPDDRQPFDFQPPERMELDLLDAGISTIIWATGYALDYGWIDAPIFGDRGYPRQNRGVTDVPGLYFIGLLWQTGEPSATLVGPTIDGPHIVEQMALAAV